MPKGESFSRRDFLKITGAVAVGLAAKDIAETAATLFEPEYYENLRLPPEEYDPRTVVYKGRLTSVSELPENVKDHYNNVKTKIEEIGAIKPMNTEGYMGDAFPDNLILDPKKSMLYIDETDEGRLITQVHIRKKSPGSNFLGINTTAFVTSSALGDNSLLVMMEGNEANPLWFDDTESEGRNIIRVNTKTGKVYQIHVKEPSIIDRFKKMLKGKQASSEVSISSIDLGKNETSLKPAETIFSNKYMKTLFDFVRNLKNEIYNSSNVEESARSVFFEIAFNILYPQVFLTGRSREQMADAFKNLNNQFLLSSDLLDWQKEIIDNLLEIDLDIPLNLETSLIIAEAIKPYLDQINNISNENGLAAFFESFLKDIKLATPFIDKPQNDLNEAAFKEILKGEIELPIQIPELYFVKVERDQLFGDEKIYKWYLVGRYGGLELDQSEALAGNDLWPGDFFYTFGEVNEDLVKALRSAQVNITGLPKKISDGPFNNDQSTNKPMSFNKIAYDVEPEPVRRLNPEEIKLFWDPGQNKILIGFYDPIKPEKVILLHLDRFLNNNIDRENLFQERQMPILGGFNPKAISDVTKWVIDLIRRGYTKCSMLGLNEPAFAAGLVINASSIYTKYNELEPILTDPNFINNGAIHIGEEDLFQANTNDNAFLIKSKPEAPAVIYHFVNGSSVGQNNIGLSHDIVVRFIDFKKVILDGKETWLGVIAVNSKNKNDFYAIPFDDRILNIGSDSDFKVFIENAFALAPWLAGAYGSYKLLETPLGGKALDSIGEIIGGLILKVLKK